MTKKENYKMPEWAEIIYLRNRELTMIGLIGSEEFKDSVLFGEFSNIKSQVVAEFMGW